MFLVQFFYIAAVSSVKISFLFFYKRTFHVRRFTVVVYACLAFVVLWTVLFSIATLIQDLPISAFWDRSIKPYFTIDSTRMYIWLGGTDVFLDIVILCLPLPMIYRLRMSPKNKMALAGVFGLGGL